MGLAASQARALLLVARKSDLEYRSQCISQRKLVLSQQSEQIAKEYSQKLSNRRLQFAFYLDGNENRVQYEDLSFDSLSAENQKFVGEYRLLNSRGDIIVSSINDIPGVEVKIPVYVEIGADGNYGTTKTTKYTATDKGLGSVHANTAADAVWDADGKNTNTADAGKFTPMYIKSYKYDEAAGKVVEDYVMVQDEDGNLTKGAKVAQLDGSGNPVLDGEGKPIMIDAFSSTSNELSDTVKAGAYPLCIGQDQYSYNLTLTQEEGKNYKVYTYQTGTIPRTPDANGDYYSDDGRKYVVCEDITKNTYFQNGLRTGAFTIQKATVAEVTNEDGSIKGSYTTWASAPWQGIDVIADNLNSEDDAQAESDYEAKSAMLETQDKMLDLELKQIETQHKAVETEMDSVKKIIEGNIDKTFKIFA